MNEPGCVTQNWYYVVKPRQLQNVREFLAIPWLEKKESASLRTGKMILQA